MVKETSRCERMFHLIQFATPVNRHYTCAWTTLPRSARDIPRASIVSTYQADQDGKVEADHTLQVPKAFPFRRSDVGRRPKDCRGCVEVVNEVVDEACRAFRVDKIKGRQQRDVFLGHAAAALLKRQLRAL